MSDVIPGVDDMEIDGEEINLDDAFDEIAGDIDSWQKRLNNMPNDPSVKSQMRDYVIPMFEKIIGLISAVAEVAEDGGSDDEAIGVLDARLDEVSAFVRVLAASSRTVELLSVAHQLAARVLVENAGSPETQGLAGALAEATAPFAPSPAPVASAEPAATPAPADAAPAPAAPVAIPAAAIEPAAAASASAE